MRRYTTPNLVLSLAGHDITQANVFVTIRQRTPPKRFTVTMRPDKVEYDGTRSTVTVTLSQIQTAKLDEGPAEVQLNWVDRDGVRNATDVITIQVTRNILESEVSYGQ